LNEPQFVERQLWPSTKEIIDWHVRGTRFGIHTDADGLLIAGESGVQLTWMDAKVGDWVVTPRHGKPVEIQALWYNALRTMEQFARQFADPDANRYGELAVAARRAFLKQFWNPASGCLYDVVNGSDRDAAIRPNQVYAVSLPFTMMGLEESKLVLRVIEHHLLTPFGLRSLSPSDPSYQGRYEGGPRERDGAYHQGTVWAYLMGPFLTAYIRAFGEEGRAEARVWLDGFESHLSDAGLGQISEIFDGDAPHEPRGCFAQAWSVGELLRAASDDVIGTRESSRR
jgi:predicted glycogen debranching enzyme